MTELSWIGVYIKSSNKGLLTAIKNFVPNKLDSQLWQTDQYKAVDGIDENGQDYVYISLFFTEGSNRESFKSNLYSISGFLNAALPGSYLKTSKSWHHTNERSDLLEYEEIVV